MQSYFISLPTQLSPEILKEIVEKFGGEWIGDPSSSQGYIDNGREHVYIEVSSPLFEDEVLYEGERLTRIEALMENSIAQIIEVRMGLGSQTLAMKVSSYIAASYCGVVDNQNRSIEEALIRPDKMTG